MREPLPLYFNADGSRVNREAFESRSRSRRSFEGSAG